MKNIFNFLKFAALIFSFILPLGSHASNYEFLIVPLMARCNGFLTGTKHIMVKADVYSVWETGRHFHRAICHDGNARAVFAEIGAKGDSESNPDGGKEDGGPQQPCPGSIIGLDAQTLGEELKVTGTDFSLFYLSSRMSANEASRTVRIPLFDSNANVTGMEVEGTYADGRTFSKVATVPNEIFTFVWDGKDSLGNDFKKSTILNFTVKMTAHGRVIPFYYSVPLGGVNNTPYGFGGWTPSVHHFYDTTENMLYRGDGSSELLSAEELAGGNLRVVERDARAVYIFSSEGTHLFTKFGLTGANKYSFNYSGDNLISIVAPYSQTTTFTRDSNGLVTHITSPKGLVTELTYDTNGYLESFEQPDGSKFEMTYHGTEGLLASFKKPGGQVSSFQYDSQGRLTQDAHSGGFFSTLVRSFGVDKHDKLVTMTSPMGRTNKAYVSNTLSSNQEYQRRFESSTGEIITSRYGPVSESTTYPGYRINREYLKDKRFTADVKYLGRESFTVFNQTHAVFTDQDVVLSNSSDPFSIIAMTTKRRSGRDEWVSTLDGPSLTYTDVSPEGRVAKRSVNEFEQITSLQTGNLAPLSFSYDSDGKLSSTTQGSRTTSIAYDSNGFVISSKNALNLTTRFERDQLGRVTKKIYHDGRSEEYGYDNNGNLISIKPSGRPAHSFLMNIYELVQQYTPPFLGTNGETKYSYNDDKQLTKVELPGGEEIDYKYGTTHSRLEEISIPDSTYIFQYQYTGHRVSQISSPDQVVSQFTYFGDQVKIENQIFPMEQTPWPSVEYIHDTRFRRSALTLNDHFGMSSTANFRYDRDGLLVKAGELELSRGLNGEIKGTRLRNFSSTYSHDAVYGELTGIKYSYKNKPLLSIQYQRDNLGRIASESIDGNPSDSLSYDSSGRFVGRSTSGAGRPNSKYRYNANGNLVSGTENGISFKAEYDDQDRLIKWNNTEYTYNINGHLQSETEGNKITTYDYDVFGNLRSVVIDDGSGQTKNIQYQADGMNRRVSRSVGAEFERYLYDGIKIIGLLDVSGLLKQHFVYGTSHSPDYMIYNSKTYIFMKDVRGSILKVVDSDTGEVMQEMKYSDWGNVILDTNPGFQPFGFAGGLYDRDTKLTRFGARDYASLTSRWTAKDPIGFEGGDTNLYGYVLNDPINFIDPAGLDGFGNIQDGSAGYNAGKSLFNTICLNTGWCTPLPDDPPSWDPNSLAQELGKKHGAGDWTLNPFSPIKQEQPSGQPPKTNCDPSMACCK